MADGSDAKTRCKPDMECLGGQAFLLLAVGIFCIMPGSILMALYGSEPGYTTLRLGSYILFITGACFIVIGVLLIIFWCQASGYKTLPDKMDDKERGTSNGKAKGIDGKDKQKDKEKATGSGKTKLDRADSGCVPGDDSHELKPSVYLDYAVSFGSDAPESSASSASSDHRYQYENPVLRQQMYEDEDD